MGNVITIGQMMREGMQQVRPGVLLYRCRACGCTVRVGSKQAELDASTLALVGQAFSNDVHSDMYNMAKVTMPHRCGEGQVGVCDLIGSVAGGFKEVLIQR